MSGEYVGSVETPGRYLEVEIRIVSKNLRETIDELNGILATDEPVPIIFPDEPDKTYYGMVEDTGEEGEKVHLGRHDAFIYIRRSDPFKYGQEKEYEFQEDTAIIENKGTAEADPIFELEVLEPTTFAMVSNGDEYMMIGQVPEIDETPIEENELIDRFTMGTTTGWTDITEIEGGAVAGHIISDGDTFRPNSYGNGSNWHGPALKTSLTEQLQDFRVDVFCSLKATTGQQVGRLEVYLFGAGNEVVGKLAMKDIRKGTNVATGEARIGDYQTGHYLINTPGIREGLWNDFYGILRLTRIGNMITAYIARIDNGVYNTAWSASFEDTQGLFQEKITQVGVHFGQNGTSPFIADIGVHEIRMFKINDPNANQIPIIADEGDIITLDNVNENILINGESRIDLKDFGASYFKLKPGENSLVVLPEDTFNTNLKLRKRYR